MKIVYFGTPAWAVPSLEAIAASRHVVLGVVTAPDAAQGRSRQLRPTPVKEAALARGIAPILQPATLRDAAVRSMILELAPDALVVVAYGRILPGRLLDAPRHGAINLHFSLLPRWRGASPVQHTILAGDREGGVTTMKIDRGLDTGPVYAQRATNIGDRETAAGLGARLALDGAALLVQTLDGIEDAAIAPRPQFEPVASHAPILRREDGLVRWAWSAIEIDRRVRAFDPWPPVVCAGPKGVIRLVDVLPVDAPVPEGARPGEVIARAGEAFDVAAGGGTILRVLRVQPAGGKVMTGAAALAGRYAVAGAALADGDLA